MDPEPAPGGPASGEGLLPSGPWPCLWGRFTVLGPLAQGGMGEVFLGLVGALSDAQRLCVLKTVRADLAHDPAFRERFLDEARVLCALTHPNIAQVLEVGVEAEVPFLVLEHVAGVDLDTTLEALATKGLRCPWAMLGSVLLQSLEGMAFAHRAQRLDGTPLELVHRDLSPQNLRLSWEGDVKVLDFGTAHAAGRSVQTAHGLVYGKPGYMSPEQARGELVDARSDLFALGVVAWEMATGRDFATLSHQEHMAELASGRLAVPSLLGHCPDAPAALDAWLQRLTAFKPSERFPDASAARRELVTLCHREGWRTDREVLSLPLTELFPGEREAEKGRVKDLVARAKNLRPRVPRRPSGTLRTATTEPLPGSTGANIIRGTRYRIGARLGAGGMGEVYAAEHIDLARPVALKLLYSDRSNDAAVVQRFRMEARAIAALAHPNLVQVYDCGETDDGRLFYAMERLLGETLRDRLEREQRLTLRESCRVGASVARGLAAAHAVGLVHRDIKPENVFLTRDGAVKVLDFGIAKTTNAELLGPQRAAETRAGEIFGSPGYMAPEQARGQPVDARTDLYALGVMLYECVTGEPLVAPGTLVEMLARQLVEEPVPPRVKAPDANIPPALERLILQCLKKEPEGRPSSALTVADTLERVGSLRPETPTETLAAGPAVPPAPPLRRGHPTVLYAGMGLLSLGVLGLLALPRSGPTQPTPRPVASSPPPSADAVTERPPRIASPPLPTPALILPPSPTSTVDVVTAVEAPRDAGVGAHGRPVSLYQQARAALEAGQHERAASLAEDAIAAGQGGVRARNLLGLALMRSGRRAEALRAWRLVLAREPDNAEARRYLTMAGESP
ncbi:MAG: protein kinase [Deltaproteobacteria bacterium]|nr:protein kinase [Deltaproteobacteria bacterium]